MRCAMPRLQLPGRCCCRRCCCWWIVALTLAACALPAHAHPGKFTLSARETSKPSLTVSHCLLSHPSLPACTVTSKLLYSSLPTRLGNSQQATFTPIYRARNDDDGYVVLHPLYVSVDTDESSLSLLRTRAPRNRSFRDLGIISSRVHIHYS